MSDFIRRPLEGAVDLVTFPVSALRRLDRGIRSLSEIPDQVRALADLPQEIEQNIRTTNELIKVSRTQLAILQKQTEVAIEVMNAMHATADRVQSVSDPVLQAARQATDGVRGAGERAAQTREEVARTNELLGRIISLAEPLERAQRQGFNLLFGRTEEKLPAD